MTETPYDFIDTEANSDDEQTGEAHPMSGPAGGHYRKREVQRRIEMLEEEEDNRGFLGRGFHALKNML